MILLSIHSAELVDTLWEPMWLIYFRVPGTRFPIARFVSIDYPKSCLGGLWCEDFGCIPGDNVFTRANPEILLEEGQELPEDWEPDWEEAAQEVDGEEMRLSWGGEGDCWACDDHLLHTEDACWKDKLQQC